MTPEFILQLILAIGGPVAVYGAIKADIATAIAKAAAAEAAAIRAHERIDTIHQVRGQA